MAPSGGAVEAAQYGAELTLDELTSQRFQPCRIDGPAGAPVLMLSSSLISSHRMWDPHIDALLARYRVLR